MLALYRT